MGASEKIKKMKIVIGFPNGEDEIVISDPDFKLLYDSNEKSNDDTVKNSDDGEVVDNKDSDSESKKDIDSDKESQSNKDSVEAGDKIKKSDEEDGDSKYTGKNTMKPVPGEFGID